MALGRAGPRDDGGGARLRDGRVASRDWVEIGVTAGQARGSAGFGAGPACGRISKWNWGGCTDWKAGLAAGSQAGAELGAGSRQSTAAGGDSGSEFRAVGGALRGRDSWRN